MLLSFLRKYMGKGSGDTSASERSSCTVLSGRAEECSVQAQVVRYSGDACKDGENQSEEEDIVVTAWDEDSKEVEVGEAAGASARDVPEDKVNTGGKLSRSNE